MCWTTFLKVSGEQQDQEERDQMPVFQSEKKERKPRKEIYVNKWAHFLLFSDICKVPCIVPDAEITTMSSTDKGPAFRELPLQPGDR